MYRWSQYAVTENIEFSNRTDGHGAVTIRLTSQYSVTENIELCNRKDGHDTVTVGRDGITVYCNREYRTL